MMIAIDGPAGSGKSSTARAVAARLGLQYLDSGALYRAIALRWSESGFDDSLFDALTDLSIRFRFDSGTFRVWIADREVTDAIRSAAVSDSVSDVASKPVVRAHVNHLLRSFASNHDCIADGRDLGTVVFPDAEMKFFMDASDAVRADRRTAELKAMGQDADRGKVLDNIRRRDHQDSTRSADPLRMAENAVRIQTDSLSFSEQVDLVCEHIRVAMSARRFQSRS